MNTLTLATLPVLAAAIVATQNPEPVAPAIDDELLAALFEPAMSAAEPESAGAGLGPHRGLQTGRLEMGRGLQSAARGLTPEAEWRAMFPVKPGTR